jgi:hypothetical protein
MGISCDYNGFSKATCPPVVGQGISHGGYLNISTINWEMLDFNPGYKMDNGTSAGP